MIMQKFTIILIITFVSACVFIPEDPQPPGGEKFVDRLNLYQIVAGSSASFSFNSYLELFEDGGNFFLDINNQSYSTQKFISRLTIVNADKTMECNWTNQSGEEYISPTLPTVLRARNFKIVSQNLSDTISGEVRITLKRTDSGRWLITKWEEMDEKYSYFHPIFGGVSGN